ncbi:hypothetical protein L1887_32143 [Cichorium endivia]|nr:hypothetical protein L1887_32143 [Cichorium endivia]
MNRIEKRQSKATFKSINMKFVPEEGEAEFYPKELTKPNLKTTSIEDKVVTAIVCSTEAYEKPVDIK